MQLKVSQTLKQSSTQVQEVRTAPCSFLDEVKELYRSLGIKEEVQEEELEEHQELENFIKTNEIANSQQSNSGLNNLFNW